MNEVNRRPRVGLTALHAGGVVVVMSAAMALAAPQQPTAPYVSPYTRAAIAQHIGATHLTTGGAPTAMQAAGKPSKPHAPTRRR